MDNDIMIIYDQRLVEALVRAQEFCEKEGLEQIETIFLLKEILKEGDCRLYEFFQDEEINSEYIDDKMTFCIEGITTEIKEDNHEEEESVTFECTLTDEKTYDFKVSNTLGLIMQDAIMDGVDRIESRTVAKSGEQQILLVTVNGLVDYIMLEMPKDVTRFIRSLDLKTSDVKQYLAKAEFSDETEEVDQEIPNGMTSFLKNITDDMSKDDTKLILGREKESRELWKIISKKNKRNAVLVGEPGVGKTALVYKLAQDIKHGDCPEQFANYQIVSLDITGMIAGTTYRGQAEERFSMLNTFLQQSKNVILFIDEIHTMLGAGSCSKGELDLANSMKPILAGDKAIVIGATTNVEYQEYFAKDGALKRRFEKVTVKEPSSKEVYPMLKNRIKDLEEYHGVKVTREIIDFIIFTASCFNYETSNPDRTLDLLDKAMVVAKLDGKQSVDKKSVLKNYDVHFETFKKMSLPERKAVAYHEAGHFVVHQMSGRLKDTKTVAVSIMPSEDYLGVNVYEETDETISPTLEYYLDRIAQSLAGRVAERKVVSNNSGVASDLEMATKLAYSVITRYGMIDGYNMAYLKEENINLVNDEVINKVNESVKELLNKAELRAEEILKENEDLLEAVVKELLQKQMISCKDLERIMKNRKANACK